MSPQQKAQLQARAAKVAAEKDQGGVAQWQSAVAQEASEVSGSSPAPVATFNRNEYMRTYMKAYRAKKKAVTEPTQ